MQLFQNEGFFFSLTLLKYSCYNIVLVSDIQKSDLVIFFFRFFYIIGFYKILNIVSSAFYLSILYIVVCVSVKQYS